MPISLEKLIQKIIQWPSMQHINNEFKKQI